MCCLCLGFLLVVWWLCLGCVFVVSWVCLGCVLDVSSLCIGCILVVPWLCLSCVLVVSWLCLGCVSAVSCRLMQSQFWDEEQKPPLVSRRANSSVLIVALRDGVDNTHSPALRPYCT